MITTAALRRAAATDSDAQFRLGYRLAFRRNARPRWRAALVWWQRAARAGHARAAFYVATCHDFGHGTPRDLRRAIRSYRQAADAGHEVAQYNLWLAYRDGDGVRKDLAMGLRWLRYTA